MWPRTHRHGSVPAAGAPRPTYRRLEQTRPFLFMRGEVERKKEEARETAKQNFREALRQEGVRGSSRPGSRAPPGGVSGQINVTGETPLTF